MKVRSGYVLVVCILLLSIFIVGCTGVTITSNTLSKDTPTNDCKNYITTEESQQLIQDLNKYVEITNLCFGKDNSFFVLEDEAAVDGVSTDFCVQQGRISIRHANELIDEENNLIDKANRCTGGSNFPLIEHKEKFGEG